MKIILSAAAASLLGAALHPAFAGNIKPRGPAKAHPNGMSRGPIDTSGAGDLSQEPTMSIQGKPEGRTARLKRKAGAPANGAEFWYGETDDGSAAANLLPCRNDPSQACGSLSDYEEGVVYSFRTDANGDTVVDATPYSAFPPDAEPEEIVEPETVSEGESPDRRRVLRRGGGGGLAGRLRREGEARAEFVDAVVAPAEEERGRGLRQSSARNLQGNTIMDVMVVWTPKAECVAAGLAAGCTLTAATTSNMETLIALAVLETNQAYANSGVSAELRLVHSYLQPDYVEAATDAFGTALTHIRSTDDGVMDDVHAQRTLYGADIVAMLIDDGQYCGLGYVGPSKAYMFSVSSWSCATGYYTFGHEIGHNQGCLHDRGTQNTCSETGTYRYGWRDPQAEFRTIMAYSCVAGQCDGNAGGYCPKVQQFSNPTNTHNDKAVGSTDHDNARRINEQKDTIAAYYPAANQCMDETTCGDGDQCTQDICNAQGICVNPPVDCDDNDVCTADSCSGGACSNTPISCDDGNACTTDTCDSVTGCANTPIPNCCGNNICEAGEDASSCAIDCALGPFDLTTPSCSSCTILDGMMFDVKATGAKIQVQTMGIRTYAPTGTFEVWTRSGSHTASQNSLSGWTQIATHTFSTSAWSTVEIPHASFTAVDIDPAVDGGVRAFYVTIQDQAVEDRILVTSGTAVGTLLSSDANGVEIYEGTGKVFRVAGTYGGAWEFNGNIEYLKIPAGPAPTPAPVTPTDAPTKAPVTPGPTKAPTPNPTKAPTPSPTANPTKAPVTPTDAPTKAPVTSSPTKAPTSKAPTFPPTSSPTKAPTTPEPTFSPTPPPTDAPTTCGNGVCDATDGGCAGCPSDCPSGSTPGASCGNGLCEAANGETTVNCGSDCNGITGGNPSNRFSCGGPDNCDDARCNEGSFACTTVETVASSYCCGDNQCTGEETVATCPLDCVGAPTSAPVAPPPPTPAPVPAPTAGCQANGGACSSGADCCSGNCKGNGTCGK